MALLPSFDERRLLVTDLDGALVGEDTTGLHQLQRALEKAQETLLLVYVSGRQLFEQVETIEKHQLLLPDYIISAVGTEIHRMPGERPLDEWYTYIQVGFVREQIVSFMTEHSPQPELQPPENQTPLKVSYFWENASASDLETLQLALGEAQLPVKMVFQRRI